MHVACPIGLALALKFMELSSVNLHDGQGLTILQDEPQAYTTS